MSLILEGHPQALVVPQRLDWPERNLGAVAAAEACDQCCSGQMPLAYQFCLCPVFKCLLSKRACVSIHDTPCKQGLVTIASCTDAIA